MIFSTPELTALTSISGGVDLPGIRLGDAAADAEAVEESLRDKGVVDPAGHLTDIGAVSVRVVEQYRTAAKHVFIGRTRVGVGDDGSLTLISPADQGWQVVRTAKETLMLTLMERFPFLRAGSSPHESQAEWEPMPYEKWVDTVVAMGPENLLVVNSRLKGQPPTDLMAYGLKDGKGYEYNLSRARGRARSVRDIRVGMAQLIGLEEGMNHGA